MLSFHLESSAGWRIGELALVFLLYTTLENMLGSSTLSSEPSLTFYQPDHWWLQDISIYLSTLDIYFRVNTLDIRPDTGRGVTIFSKTIFCKFNTTFSRNQFVRSNYSVLVSEW